MPPDDTDFFDTEEHGNALDAATRTRAVDAYTGLRQRGMDPETALGYAANFVQESRANPYTRPGDKGHSHGMPMWNGPRLERYQVMHGHNPEEGDLNEQLDHVVWENQGPEAEGYQRILNTSGGPGAKAAAVSTYWERPKATAAEESRRSWIAQQLIPHAAAAELINSSSQPQEEVPAEPTVASRVEAARNAGYTDQQIADYLEKSKTIGPKIQAARAAKYNDQQIFGHYGLKLGEPTADDDHAEDDKKFPGFHYDSAKKQMVSNDPNAREIYDTSTPEPPVPEGDARGAQDVAMATGAPSVATPEEPPATPPNWKWGLPGHEDQPLEDSASTVPVEKPRNLGEHAFQVAKNAWEGTTPFLDPKTQEVLNGIQEAGGIKGYLAALGSTAAHDLDFLRKTVHAGLAGGSDFAYEAMSKVIGEPAARTIMSLPEAFPLFGQEMGGLRGMRGEPTVAPLTEREAAVMREAKGWSEAPLTINPDAARPSPNNPENAFAWQKDYYPQYDPEAPPRLTGPEGSSEPPISPGGGPAPSTPPPGRPPTPEAAAPRPLTPEAAAAAEAESPVTTAPEASPPAPTAGLPLFTPTPPVAPRTVEPALEPMPPQEKAAISTLETLGGKPPEAPTPETPPHTTLHEAPDGSGAMTDLSDEDYAKIMQRSAPVPPVEVQGEHPEVNVVAPEAEAPPSPDKPLPVPREPQRLIPFLQQGVKINEGTPTERTAQFGLKDKSISHKGGDLNKIMGGPRTRLGFINNVSGETLENAGQRAWQAGYFDHRPDINELLEAIRKDHNNIPQFSAHDQAAVEAYNYATEWNKQIARGEVPAERPDTFVPPSQEEANYWASLPEGQFQAPRRLPAPPNQGEDLFGSTRAQPTQRTPGPTIRNDPRQQTLEGMEPSARQAQAAKDAETSKPNQLLTDQGLFARQEPAPTTELPFHEPVLMPPLASRWIRSAGEKPVDLLREIPNRFGGHEAAAAWVFHKGRETGHEHLAVVDNQTGEIVHAHTNNEPSVVRFAMENGIYQPGRYTVHHSHPRDTALSGGDVAALAARGVSHVVAHTAGGSTSAATLSPDIQSLLSTNVHEITGLTNQLLAAHEEAMKASMAILHPFMRDGRLTLDEANHLYSDLANRLMHAKGFIDYTSTVEVPTFVRDALHRELEKVNAPLPYDRYTGSIRPEDRVAGLPSPLREGKRSPVPSGGRPGAQELARPREGPIIDGKTEFSEDAAHQGEHSLAGELNAPPGIPAPIKKAAADLLDTKEGASLRDRLTEFLAPMRLGTKETAENAFNFANFIRKQQFNYGELAKYVRHKFSVDNRWKMGRAQAEQSVFERKLSRELDSMFPGPLGSPARAAYEAAIRTRFDAIGIGHAGLTAAERYEVEQGSKLAENTFNAKKLRGMVAPDAEGWAHFMPRQLVIMEPGKKARRIVQDDSILPPVSGSKGKGGSSDLNPFGTNMHTDTRGFRNYEEVEATLDAARRKYGPHVYLVDDILGLYSVLQHENESIHGHDLLQSIIDYSKRTGNKVAYTGGGAEPGFTIQGNPSMWKVQPKLTKDATGKTIAETTPDGKPVWEKIPVWVHNDYRGPISSVFRSPPGGLEKAFMGLKALSTHFVMQSPLTHLNVELGRALPLLAGRTPVVLTLAAGRRARMNNDPRVQLLLDHGMAPISRGFIGDPVSLMQEANYAPPMGALGRAIYESPIGSLGKAVVAAHDALARGAGKLPGGEFFEKVLRRPIQTLLWNRVLDLQTSIGLGMYEDRIKAGWAPEAAATAAAHLANRYAGALPPEAMSKTLNTLANIALFSRSFTGGNLGVMKDTMTGAPKHVLDHIGAAAGPAAQDAAKEWLKHKAQWTFALDIALFYGFTVAVQTAASAVYNAVNGKDPEETMGEGYARRFHNAMSYVAEHPVKAMWIPHDIAMLLPTADNEPGKEDRSRIAPLAASPQWIYARTPAGKVGEEFLSWLTDPMGTLGRKQSTVLKTINEAVSGKDSFGRDIRRPGGGEETANAWRSTERFLQSLFPTEPESQLYTALGAPGSSLWGAETPTRKERILAGAQFAGSLSGVYQPSRGYPLGPVAGAEAERERQIQFDVGAAMPEVRRLAAQGKDEEARSLLLKAGQEPRKAARAVANMLPENTEGAAMRSANIKNRNAARRGDQPILDRADQIRRSYGLSAPP